MYKNRERKTFDVKHLSGEPNLCYSIPSKMRRIHLDTELCFEDAVAVAEGLDTNDPSNDVKYNNVA